MKTLAIIPAYNAEKTIGEVIEGLLKTFDAEDILVVDDGSNDATFAIAKNYGVRVMRHENNTGKGAALKTAFHIALDDCYDAVLTLDSDMQHPPELARVFIEEMERSGADVVVGNRLGDISAMPVQRRFSNKTTSFFVRLWTGAKIPDSQCGYRLIKKWIIEQAELRIEHYQIETELVLEAARLGAKFSSVPIPTIYNENESKMNAFAETFRFIGLMLAHPFRRKEK